MGELYVLLNKMKPIPKELNLDRLVGQMLQQICIGPNDLQFRFEGDDRISCEGCVSVTLAGIHHEIFTEDGWSDISPLSGIVGQIVESWRVDSPNVLQVILAPATILSFTSSDSAYEDFVVDPEALVW